jgi:hypothetical protein
VLLIQAVAALLLLAGSAIVFKALAALDAPSDRRRASAPRPRPHLGPRYHDEDLPRAA